MPPRIKKLIGLAILLPALPAYFLVVASFADRIPNYQLVKGLYYLIVGIGWAFPTYYLIRWTSAEPKRASRPKSGQ